MQNGEKDHPERNLEYREKFRECMRENYYKKKKAAEEEITIDRKDYENMTIHELSRLGKLRKIKYCGHMTKAMMIDILKANDKDPSIKKRSRI